MTHADYYIYVGLLRVSRCISECFGDKECVTFFMETHAENTRKHIIQNNGNILNYGQNRKYFDYN